MQRQCKNWIQTYLKYYENTEPATIFHTWTAISMIAGALRKKVHLEQGRLKVFPNLYIVFVAEPGIARKSQSISFGLSFLRNIPDIVVSAEATTREALLQDLEASAQDEALPDGTIYKHCSLSITSKEFETFLGQKKENAKMLVLLTDLYDAEEMPWKYRTKASGSNVIPSVFINLLAATTPDSLASSLPPTAIGGGLTSRILFVWASGKAKKVPRPKETKGEQELRERLQKDLYIISRIAGKYQFSKSGGEFFDEWYYNYDETSPQRLCKDRSFASWYSRKPSTVLKVSMALSAAEHSHLTLEPEFIQDAIKRVEAVEREMGNAFRGVGKSDIAGEISYIVSQVKTQGRAHHQELMNTIWRDADSDKMRRALDTAMAAGLIRMEGKYYVPGKEDQCDKE